MAASARDMSLAVELRELAELRNHGALSEEEFSAAKASLLRVLVTAGAEASTPERPSANTGPATSSRTGPTATFDIGARSIPDHPPHCSASASEPVLYSDNDRVTVTNTRAIIDHTMYTIVNVTSVRATVLEPDRRGPLLLFAAALFLAIFAKPLALLVVLGAVVWFFAQKTRYYMFLGTASGESSVLESLDKDLVQNTRWAVNEAIARRGW